MISQTILLGFEQDIYLPDEYASMYYFLSCISARRVELIANMDSHFSTRITQLSKSSSSTSSTTATLESIAEDHAHITSLLHTAHATYHLSTAFSRFYTLLLYLQVLPIPPRPFSTEDLRYELRMKPFLTLQPAEVPPFSELKDILQPFGPYATPTAEFRVAVTDPGSAAWKEVEDALRQAKEEWARVKKLGAGAARAKGVESAWGKDVQAVLASCIALGVAVAGVKSAVTEGKEDSLKIKVPAMGVGKRYSEGWVVPGVERG